jgi:hypothetical protein
MTENEDKSVEVSADAEASPWLIPLMLGVLLTWRWMLPVESAVLGETLWISQLSLVLPPVCAAWFWKQRGASLLWNRQDTLLWVIVIGHWCSLCWLLKAGGDLRAALNLCWEWTAIGCTYFSIRQSLRTKEAKSDLLRLVMVIGIGMAGIGLWQHFVAYRFVLSDYRTMQQSYDELSQKAASGMLSRLEQDEFRQLELDFQEMNVPTAGPSREMFERRLADNRQPVGRWALTNSLGGLLAVITVLLVAAVMTNSGPRLMVMPLLAMVIYCLYETHSRTAQAATGIGILMLIVEKYGSVAHLRRIRFGLLGGIGLFGSLLVLYGLRNLDEISYDSHFALRSLQFRLQYWVGSARALGESLLFGTGPGNFRQGYLHHKLAASSEQIADPHNAILDVWANGGFMALLGLLLLGGLFLKRYLQSEKMSPPVDQPVVFQGWLSSPWFLGAELALLGLFLGQLLTTGVADWELVALVIAVPVFDVMFQSLSLKLPLQIVRISLLVLGIHLMGAGGMEMPGIVLLGLALLATSGNQSEQCCLTSLRRLLLTGAGSVVLAVLMWITTTGPTRYSAMEMTKATSAWMLEGDSASARESFLRAAAADRYSADPWRSLGELEYSIWKMTPEKTVPFERAHEAWSKAAGRNPHSSRDDIRRASAYWSAYQLTKNSEMAEKAVQWYQLADQKMPHDERIISSLALAADAADFAEISRKFAKEALEIDEISRKNGHWEKMLSDKLRLQMEAISSK